MVVFMLLLGIIFEVRSRFEG